MNKYDRSYLHEKLVDSLLLALSATDLCKVWKQPTGAAYRDGRLIHYGVIGSADISGILRGGRRLEIEVKTGRGKQTDGQKYFEQMIIDMGGMYLVARNVSETVAEVIRAVGGNDTDGN